jgi:tetratricopeptide (TPR) repeat protein
VGEAVSFKYRAFLSYSHKDTSWAKWLHGRIEGFRVDKDLVGRDTPMGPIPKNLRPVFRDRHDFSAGGALRDQTIAALDASAALVLLCSPASAKSAAVNEEVRQFISRRPDRPVIPLILDGTPSDEKHECFPKTLRFAIAADGAVTDQPLDVLAADAREAGDGRELALAKVVARLIGLAPDEVFRRAERERRRRGRVRNGVTAALALLALVASGSAVYAWQQLKTNEAFLNATLKTATEIVDTAVAQAETYNVPRTATLALLAKAEGLFDDMAKFGRPTPELRYRKAWMLIQFARNYEILGDTNNQRARAAEAQRLMAGLANEKPSDTEYQDSLAVSLVAVGDVLVAQGNLAEALKSYRDALAIADRLTKSEPNNARWESDLSVSYNRVGEVLVAQGNLEEALKSYRDTLAIADRLTKSEPNNSEWQRNLSVSYGKVGDVLMAQGNLPEALKNHRDSLVITERLAKSEPNNSELQRDLHVSYAKVGELLMALGNLPEALKSYRDGLAIADRLAKTDSKNAEWQHDLAAFHDRVGHVLGLQGNLEEALKTSRDGQAILDRLAKSDPNNAHWQRDLAASYSRVGDALGARGDLNEALKSYRDGLAIEDRLAKSDPNNAEWQSDLSESYEKVGYALVAQGNLDDAIKTYGESLAIRDRLAKSDPNNAQWQRYLSLTHARFADVFRRRGDVTPAREHLIAGRTIVAQLVDDHPDWGEARLLLAWIERQLAEIDR